MCAEAVYLNREMYITKADGLRVILENCGGNGVNPFAWLPTHRAKVYRTLVMQRNRSL